MVEQEFTFAEACYNQNSIEELESALDNPADKIDMEAWNLSEDEWREQIKAAIAALKEDRK